MMLLVPLARFATKGSHDLPLVQQVQPNLPATPSSITDRQPYQATDQILMGNGTGLPILSTGATTISSKWPLKQVLYVPTVIKNLVFVSQLTRDLNCSLEFFSDGFIVKDLSSGLIVLKGRIKYGLYVFDQAPSPSPSSQPNCFLMVSDQFEFWHRRLGHPSMAVLRQALCTSSISIGRIPASACSACQQSKSKSLPFSSSSFLFFCTFTISQRMFGAIYFF